jgi:hypothetical protein
MSNKDQYLKLWQHKRSELPVNTDPQADWLAMHHLLDLQMPVVNNATANSPGSDLVKQLSHFAKFKLFYVAAALITVAAITYVVIQHRATTKENKPAKTEVRADSVLNNDADTALINEQIRDSILQDAHLTDSVGVKASTANTKANNNGVDKNEENTNRSLTNLSAAKNKANKPGYLSNGRKPITGNINNSSGSRSGANNSRLLSSANKTTNGLAFTGNKAINSSRSRVSNSAGRKSGNNTGQAINKQRQSQVARQEAINELNNRQITNNTSNGNIMQNNISQSPLWSSAFIFNADAPLLVNNYATPGIVNTNTALSNAANTRILNAPNAATANLTNAAKAKNQATKPSPTKSAGDKTNSYSSLDWGILVGVNTQGSFTPKDQNKNIYGSLAVDSYAGLFATYNVSSKWAVDVQVKLLVPHSTGGSYNHVFATRNDTGQIVRQTYKITDSRKIYSAQMPLHLVYNITDNISVKAGPVINLPIKHFGASSFTALTDTVVDSIGYAGRLADTINRITFKKRISVGISGGISFNYKRLRLEAVYYRGSQPYTTSSPLGSYSPAVNNIQISLGFKLNKTKTKPNK